MPKVELYINNQLCDLRGDEEINVDYAIFDISKIGTRGGARSYEFELPKTNRNKLVFENPEIVNNLSDVPYTRLPALVLVDGVDVLIRFCEVSGVKGYYNVRVYGGNSDFFATLGDLTLYDLDLTEYDHVWTYQNAYAARNFTEGYIYPVVDYHADSPNAFINNDNRVVRVDYMPPCFFINTILSKIIEESGYTLVNEVEEDSSSLVMSLITRDVDNNEFAAQKYEAIFGISGRMEVPTYPIATTPPVTTFLFDTISGYAGTYYDLPYTVPNTTWRAIRIEDRIQFTMTVSLDITVLTSNNHFSIVFSVFDYLGNPMPGTGGQYNYQNYPIGTHNITLTFPVISFQTTQRELYYVINIRNDGNYFSDPSSIFIESSSTVTISDVVYWGDVLKYNNFLPIAALLPNISQNEFIKNYILLFGLLPFVNEVTKTVTFKKFDSLLGNIAQCYDWSNKIDFSEDHEIKFLLNSYAQHNLFKYKDEDGEITPDGANGEIFINNKNLDYEKTFVEMVYSATNMVPRINDNGVGSNIVPQIGVYEGGAWKNSKNIRLLQVNKITSTELGGFIAFADSVSSNIFGDVIPMAYFIDNRQSFNLGFEKNMLANYYDAMSDVISRLKIVRILVRLSAADISQLDFTRPVYIAKFEAYFYISAIKGFSYTSNESTMVELVKLNING